MKIVYTGEHSAVVTNDGIVFPNGDPVEVTNEMGESLTARSDFKAVKENK